MCVWRIILAPEHYQNLRSQACNLSQCDAQCTDWGDGGPGVDWGTVGGALESRGGGLGFICGCVRFWYILAR